MVMPPTILSRCLPYKIVPLFAPAIYICNDIRYSHHVESHISCSYVNVIKVYPFIDHPGGSCPPQ